MGAQIDHSVMHKTGPFTYRIHGQNAHRIGSFLPKAGQPPKFSQLYIVDTANEVENRISTVKRTANWADIAYHSVTAMVGAGVLGLPSALSCLGWAGGIIFLIFSFWVSWHTYKLLVYMHEVPDLDCKAGNGVRRLDRYDQLSAYVFGE